MSIISAPTRARNLGEGLPDNGRAPDLKPTGALRSRFPFLGVLGLAMPGAICWKRLLGPTTENKLRWFR
jgi:hypothetical protein